MKCLIVVWSLHVNLYCSILFYEISRTSSSKYLKVTATTLMCSEEIKCFAKSGV